MCGIGGKFFFNPDCIVDSALLERMNTVLAHRGPDDSGIFQNGPIGLSHCRLSIIDLSIAGHQPMSNADGTLWITFNGEIYNFQDLRKDLENQGWLFRSRTDTEVLLALYERYGTECLRYLRGMFAFAIWDSRKRLLFLARDRAGKKPLFYYQDEEKFVFASEPKGILQDFDVSVEPDFRAIHHYLTYGYVPSPYSAFKGFKKVPPAHYLLVQNGRIRLERYWRLSYESKLKMSEEDLCEELLVRLREAIRLRMISDVPLGAFLSGGIDSSAVVGLMSEYSSGPVKTFSIGFEEGKYNELSYARQVAKQYGTDHHEFIVKPNATAILPELVWYYNEPYADSSAIPTYYLSKMTREHVTVALNGDAGDENFAGYGRYLANQMARKYDRLPAFVRRSIQCGIRNLPEAGHFQGLNRRSKRFFGAASYEPRRRYARWVEYFSNSWKDGLYTPSFKEVINHVDSIDLLIQAYEAAGTDDFLDATLSVDVATYLSDDLLVKVDIASMAHSLEARSPMVDHLFMEFAASIPSTLKLKGFTKKYIFKKAVQDLLPKEVINRPKMGFGVPIDYWFRHELREMTYDTLLSKRSVERGFFRPEEVSKILDAHVSGRQEWHLQIWNLLFLELWFQKFIDYKGSSEA